MFKRYVVNLNRFGTTTIVDDDFTETINHCNSVYQEVIIVYERKGNDVARNVALLFIYILNTHGVSIRKTISYCLAAVPEYKKYHNDVHKYLALM